MPDLEKPDYLPSGRLLIDNRHAARVATALSSVFIFLALFPADNQHFIVQLAVAWCGASLALVAGARSQNERWTAWSGLLFCCGLCGAAVVRPDMFRSDVPAATFTLAFAFAALVFRPTHHRAGSISVTAGCAFTLILTLSFCFGLTYMGVQVRLPTLAAVLLLTAGALFSYADRGWLRMMLEGGPIGQVIRLQVVGAVLGPLVFGIILYQIVGVTERMLPVEALMLSFVTVVLLVLVRTSTMVRIRDQTRQQDLLRDLQSKVETDALTGLPNRMGVLGRLTEVWTDFETDGTGAAIIMFDLDHFKSINDTLGHAAGDLVLSSIRDAVEPQMRSGDVIGRWGGEEFLCVLPGAKSRQMSMIAERLRAAIESLTDPISAKLGAPCAVTASFGIAQFTDADTDVNDVLKRADKALYAAKEAGRNRIWVGGGLNLVAEKEARNVSTA